MTLLNSVSDLIHLKFESKKVSVLKNKDKFEVGVVNDVSMELRVWMGRNVVKQWFPSGHLKNVWGTD